MENDDIPTMKTEDLLVIASRALVQIMTGENAAKLYERTVWSMRHCERILAIADELSKRNI